MYLYYKRKNSQKEGMDCLDQFESIIQILQNHTRKGSNLCKKITRVVEVSWVVGGRL